MDNQIRYTVTANDLLSGRLQNMNQSAGTLNSTMGSLGGVIAGAFSIYAITSFAKEIFNTGNKVEALKNQLNFASGSTEQGAKDFNYLKDVSNQMGLEFETTSASFAKLEGATRGTSLAGEQTRKIFEGVSAASTVMHLTSEQSSGALNALQQMMSKGKVSAEELNGQLGERIPGALGIASRAMGMTTAELMKMMQNGQLLSEDFLPKFASQLNKEFSPALDQASKSGQASANRLANAWFFLKNDISESTRGMQLVVVESFMQIIEVFRDFGNFLKANKDLITALGVALLAGATAYGIFMVATNLASIELFLLNGVATIVAGTMFVLENIMTFGIPLAIAVVAGAITYAYLHFAKFRAYLYGTWEALKTVGEMIGQFFTGLKDVIVGAFTFDKDQMTKGLLEMSGSFENAGKKIGSGFNKGYWNSLAEFGKDEATGKGEKTIKLNKLPIKPIGDKPPFGDAPTKDKKGTSGVSGSKVVTVNVTIGNLINDFRIQTTNIQESTTAIKDKVLQALTSAVNDSQLVAGN